MLNLKKILKSTELDAKIKSLAKIVPISINIIWKNDKTVFSFSNTDKEPLFNFPIFLIDEKIGKLQISDDGYVKDFILLLINNTLSKERQIFEINEQIISLYSELNLLYSLSSLKVSKGYSVRNTIDSLLEICTNFFKVQNVSLWLITGDLLNCSKYKGMKPEKDSFKLGEGFLGHIACSDISEMVNAPISDSRWIGDVYPTTSAIALLLKVRLNNKGILYLSRQDGKPWETKDFKLSKVFAYQFSQEMEAIPSFLWQ